MFTSTAVRSLTWVVALCTLLQAAATVATTIDTKQFSTVVEFVPFKPKDADSPVVVRTKQGYVRGLATDYLPIQLKLKGEVPAWLIGTTGKSGPPNSLPRKFLGIPYAATTSGQNRFKRAVPHVAWTGTDPSQRTVGFTLNADRITPPCTQPTRGDVSEDCLHLDVYTPSYDILQESTKLLPVMVSIFAGKCTYFTLCGNYALNKNMFGVYDGGYLAQHYRMVVVSFNYRLGPFGFSDMPGGDSNVALFDQQDALEWIKKNIASFGGDPGNITLMGGSSGAYDILAHLTSPTTPKDLFHKAVLLSLPSGIRTLPQSMAQRNTHNMLKKLKCDDTANAVKCAQDKSANDVMKASGEIFFRLEDEGVRQFSDQYRWWPSVDGKFLKEPIRDSLLNGRYLKVPILLGNPTNEAGYFADSYGGRFNRLIYSDSKLFTPAILEQRMRTAFGAEYEMIEQLYPLPKNNAGFAASFDCIGTDLLFRCANEQLVTTMAKHGTPVYQYTLAQKGYWPFKLFGLDFCYKHACHSQDIAYFWSPGNQLFEKLFNPEQLRTAQLFQSYLANFIAHSNPNHRPDMQQSQSEMPEWTARQSRYSKHLQFNDTITYASNSRKEYCAIWDQRGYDF